MAFGIGRGLAMPLLVINFALYLVVACLAGWGLDKNFDSQNQFGQNEIGDDVTTWFLPVALIACMVGFASVLAGAHHIFVVRRDSHATAGATSLIAWLLDLLVMGIAAKEIDSDGGTRPGRLKILEALVIVLALTELLYLLSLHNGLPFWNEGGDGDGYNQGGAGHHHHHMSMSMPMQMQMPHGHAAHP